jgi:orotidine-5'-phosphate decarboxylase
LFVFWDIDPVQKFDFGKNNFHSTDFVIPGNKPEKAMEYVDLINKKIKNPVFYSPGLIAQGGRISDLARKLDSWHAIVGRTIYEAKDMKKAAEDMTKELIK